MIVCWDVNRTYGCKITHRTCWWRLEILKVYHFLVIYIFAMYYIYGMFGSSLLTESTDSMILDYSAWPSANRRAMTVLCLQNKLYLPQYQAKKCCNMKCRLIIRWHLWRCHFNRLWGGVVLYYVRGGFERTKPTPLDSRLGREQQGYI